MSRPHQSELASASNRKSKWESWDLSQVFWSDIRQAQVRHVLVQVGTNIKPRLVRIESLTDYLDSEAERSLVSHSIYSRSASVSVLLHSLIPNSFRTARSFFILVLASAGVQPQKASAPPDS